MHLQKLGRLGMMTTCLLAGGMALSPATRAADPTPAAGHKPTSPPLPYFVKSAASLADLEKTLQGQGSHAADLVKPGPVDLEVVLRREQDVTQELSEIHDGKDHVFYITEGSATFLLGGQLDGAKEVSPGEWRSAVAKGGQAIPVKKGDLLFIPHGTVHGRTAKGSHFTMLQLSFWPGGAPPSPPAPAAKK